MLNFGSKPSQDASLRKIAIWGADLILCSAPKFGPHPGGSYGGRGGLSFYVKGKGRQWTHISHRKLKTSISHSMVIWVQEPDPMLSPCKKMKFCLFFEKFRVNYTFANARPAHFCFLPEPSTVGGNKHLLQLYNDYLIIDIQQA